MWAKKMIYKFVATFSPGHGHVIDNSLDIPDSNMFPWSFTWDVLGVQNISVSGGQVTPGGEVSLLPCDISFARGISRKQLTYATTRAQYIIFTKDKLHILLAIHWVAP